MNKYVWGQLCARNAPSQFQVKLKVSGVIIVPVLLNIHARVSHASLKVTGVNNVPEMLLPDPWGKLNYLGSTLCHHYPHAIPIVTHE